MPPPFQLIWINHPNQTDEPPLLDKRVYENQCAINLSAALIRAGMNMAGYTGTWSWQSGKPRYAIRAHELAAWLKSPAAAMPKWEAFKGKEVFGEAKDEKGKPKPGITKRSGIVYFEGYWGANQNGNHIDLWDGWRLTHWTSWLQIHARISSDIGINSDLRKARQTVFWPLR